MGRFETTKQAIDANIKQNGNQAITGQILNSVMKDMLSATDAELTELSEEVAHHFEKETSETYDYLHNEIGFALKKGAKIVNHGIELQIASDISLADKVSIYAGDGYVLDSDKGFLCSVPVGHIDFDYVPPALTNTIEDVSAEVSEVLGEINGNSIQTIKAFKGVDINLSRRHPLALKAGNVKVTFVDTDNVISVSYVSLYFYNAEGVMVKQIAAQEIGSLFVLDSDVVEYGIYIPTNQVVASGEFNLIFDGNGVKLPIREELEIKYNELHEAIQGGFLLASSISGWKSSPVLYIDYVYKNDTDYGSGIRVKDGNGQQVLYKNFPRGEKRVGIEKIIEQKDDIIISLVVNWDYYEDGFNKVLAEPIYLPKLSFLSDTSQSLANTQKIAELYQNVPTHHFEKQTDEIYDYLHNEIGFSLKKGAKIVNKGIELLIATDISLADKVSIPKGGEYVLDSDKGFLCSVPVGLIDFDYIQYASPGEVEDLRKVITESGADRVEIVLPSKIYAVVGDTLQLFYHSILKVVNPYVYDIVIQCSKGNCYPRYWEYTPSASDVGEMELKVFVRNNTRETLASASCKVVTNAASSPSNQVNVACFGDSLTAGGEWCAEAARRLTAEGGDPIGGNLKNIAFVGKKSKNGYGYFGEGGWTWKSYTTKDAEPAFRFNVSGVNALSINATYSLAGITYTIKEINVTAGNGNILCIPYGSANPPSSGTMTKLSGTGDESISYTSVQRVGINPLWDDSLEKMSFVPYANLYCNGSIDVVCTLLTWNGLAGGQTSFDVILEQVKIFADTLHAEFPKAKLMMLGLQMPSFNGGMGANYGATGINYADRYGMMHTAMNLNRAYQLFAESDAYKSFVTYVDVASQFDSENNMPSAETPVNTRNPKVELRGTNGVHPSLYGYYQIADVVYRALLAIK